MSTPYQSFLRGEPGYPSRLLCLEMAPAQLWACGRWDASRPAVAIIGARAASEQGLQAAHDLAARLCQAGVAVVSGGALGIDAAAHQGALAARGATCVVLGSGVDVAYPQRHAGLFAQVVEQEGCLLSPFPLGTPPKPWHFPVRNHLVAALSDAVVVIESQLGSGSRYTALHATRLGRPLFALPGSPGNADLLCQGARPLRDAADLLPLLPALPAGPGLGLELDRDRDRDPDGPTTLYTHTSFIQGAQELRAALDSTPRDLGELSLRAGLPPSTCAAAIVDLEMQGQCLRLAGGRYVALEHAS